MPRPCAGDHAPSPDSCHFCKLARDNPRYAGWREGGDAPPRRQIDPDKPRLPKGVPP